MLLRLVTLFGVPGEKCLAEQRDVVEPLAQRLERRGTARPAAAPRVPPRRRCPVAGVAWGGLPACE